MTELRRIDTTELDEHVRTLEEFASSDPLEHQDTRQEAEGEGR